MRNILKILLPLTLLTVSSISLAQEQANVTPMEFYANCEFQPGKTKADLYDVIEKWNKFNDDSKEKSYTAFLLTPIAASNIDFENTLIWMGIWDNFEGMGNSLENYYANGSEIAESFNSVWKCNSHSFAASLLTYEENRKDNYAGPRTSEIFSFSDCSINDGVTYADLLKADAKYSAFLKKLEKEDPVFRIFPTAGLPQDSDFDFKMMDINSSWSQRGKETQTFVDNGGPLKQLETYGSMVSCDSPRVYQMERIRLGKPWVK